MQNLEATWPQFEDFPTVRVLRIVVSPLHS
jgi:hypothetical protein